MQLAQLAGRREVLVLVGDADLLDAVAGGEAGDDRLDDLLGALSPGGDAHDVPGEVVAASSSAPLMRCTTAAARLPGHLHQGQGVGGVGAADDHHGVGPGGDVRQRGLAVGGGEAQVVAAGASTVRGTAPGRVQHALPVVWDSVVWASMATWRVGDPGSGGDVPACSTRSDRLGGDGHGADGLVVALVAHVQDGDSPCRHGS